MENWKSKNEEGVKSLYGTLGLLLAISNGVALPLL